MEIHPSIARGVSPAAGAPAELRVGGEYRALVTGVVGDRIEVFLANRYFLARTNLSLLPGRVLALVLAESRPELLTFRLVGSAGTVSTTAVPTGFEALLAELGLEGDAAARGLAELLDRFGIEPRLDTMSLFLRLRMLVGPERLPILATLYSQLVEARVKPDLSLMGALASYLAGGTALGTLVVRLLRERERRGRSAYRDIFEALKLDEETLNSGELREIARFLYSPVEAELSGAMNDADTGAGLPSVGGLSTLMHRVLSLEEPGGEEESEEGDIARAILAQVEAINILNALPGPGFLLELPIEIGGEAASLMLDVHRESTGTYEESATLILALETERLGRIEAVIRMRGRRFEVELYARDERTLAIIEVLSEELDFKARLREALRSSSVDFSIKRLSGPPAEKTPGIEIVG